MRAFVETPAGAPDERVTGRLIGRRDGVELPGSPLVATNASGSVLARNDIVARRGEIEDSLNFELPFSWTYPGGDIELEFDAGGAPVDCKEPSDPGTSGRRLPRGAAVRDADGARDRVLRRRHRRRRAGWSDVSEQIARVQSALPVSTSTGPRASSTTTTRPSIEEVNDDLHRMREVERTSCGDSCGHVRDIFYGLIDGGPLGGLNGQANGIPSDAATSVTNNLNNPTSTGYARNTVVHEISHSLGVHHAVDNSLGESGGFLWWGKHKTGRCGESASTDAPGHDPFITVAEGIRPGLGPIDDADDEVWGVDHRFARADENGLGLSDPEETWALMSYCNDGRGQ